MRRYEASAWARSTSTTSSTARSTRFSSFPATPERCAELLYRRGGVARDVALVLAVLAGGNPRELLRLTEIVGAVETGSEAALQAIRDEALDPTRDRHGATSGRLPDLHPPKNENRGPSIAFPTPSFSTWKRSPNSQTTPSTKECGHLLGRTTHGSSDSRSAGEDC